MNSYKVQWFDGSKRADDYRFDMNDTVYFTAETEAHEVLNYRLANCKIGLAQTPV